MVGIGIHFVFFIVIGIDYFRTASQPQFFNSVLDRFRASQQDWGCNTFFLDLIGRTDDLGFFTFSKDYTFGPARRTGFILEEIAYLLTFTLTVGQLLFVFIDVDLLTSYTGFHRHLSHCGCFP